MTGTVQGVGFRPFVYRLARERGLSGFVRNAAGEVVVEVEGDGAALESFAASLTADAPPLARVQGVRREELPPAGDAGFTILSSDAETRGEIAVSPDAAPCPDCLRELFDPADRRYGYPFLNCTSCGPRLTIVESAPYDRPRTSMAGFPMCDACRREYEEPGDRRFHAQPNACPACGPRLRLRDAAGLSVEGDPLETAAAALLEGRIVAVKSLGGYHLACDAANERAVDALRRRKRRDDKPFALLVGSLDEARALCRVSEAEAALLAAPETPIVLLRRLPGAAVAPGVHSASLELGLMLPPSPLHHLLARRVKRPLVMTSGNASDEPIAYEDADAALRLAPLADLILSHDRPIVARCDDSVAAVDDAGPYVIRRARGYAPRPLTLPRALAHPALAVGGQLKSVFALGRGRAAVLSQHFGDLDDYAAYRAFTEGVERFERLFDTRPELLVCDLHPDYASSRYALERSRLQGLRLLRVQHHHAHLASALAESGLEGPAIGVAFDGTGFGPDGTVWGGEILAGDAAGFIRQARLRRVPMPGGEAAVREPWRMALAHLDDAGVDAGLLAAVAPGEALAAAGRALSAGVNAPLTSSMGRLFDAVSALLGVRSRVSYEGQAAAELEWLADSETAGGPEYPFEVDDSETMEIDTRPLIRAVAGDILCGTASALVARRFHATAAAIVAAACERVRERTGLARAALTGGVFMNRLLRREAAARLSAAGFEVVRHRQVPCGDGGLCLGQLAVAAAGGGQS